MDCVRHNRRPREIATRTAFENAIAGVAATGGSTNAVLHLLAMAREAGVPLAIDDFQKISSRTPLLVDLKPGGRFVAVDVDKAGGIGVIAQRLVEGGYVDGVGAYLHRPHLRRRSRRCARDSRPGSHPPARPSPSSRAAAWPFCAASLAPDGCVIKLAGHDKHAASRPGARLRSRGGRHERGHRRQDQAGRCGGHPLRRAARRSRHARDAGRHRRHRRRRACPNSVALVTDGRFSGATHGFMVAHVAPEASERRTHRRGARRRLHRDRRGCRNHQPGNRAGDPGERLAAWTPPAPRYTSGVFAKYCALVASASEGAVTVAPTPR